MLSTGRRDGVGEKNAGIDQAGEAEGMFAVQALDFTETAQGRGRGWKEFESRNCNC